MYAKAKRNLSYVYDQFRAALSNCSTITKVFCALILIGHICSYNRLLFDGLTLTPLFLPRLFYSFYTLLTHAFVEKKVGLCVLDLVSVFLCGKLIEPLWGTVEMLKFFALIAISTGFYTSIVYLLAYAATFNVSYLFDIRIAGLAAYLAAISVAVKQIMPDHVLLSFKARNLKLRNNHLPFLLFLVTLILKYAGLFDYNEYLELPTVKHLSGRQPDNTNYRHMPWRPDQNIDNLTLIHPHHMFARAHKSYEIKVKPSPYPWMFGIGLLTSWIYLRFYQSHSNGSRGDMEDSFSFASFFPSAIQPPIAIVSNVLYKFFTKIHLCKKPTTIRKMYDPASTGSTASASVILNLPGMDTYDAERRRLKALKALNERMNKSGTQEPTQWPSHEPSEDNDFEITGEEIPMISIVDQQNNIGAIPQQAPNNSGIIPKTQAP